MSEKQKTINCPKCGEEFDVNHQMEQQVKKRHDEELRGEKQRLEETQKQLKEDKERQNQNVDELLKEASKERSKSFMVKIAEGVAKEQTVAIYSRPSKPCSFMSYPCTNCGLCCQNIAKIDELVALDDGSGSCKHYVPKQGCNIYETRPAICRVDEGYLLYAKDKLSRDDYYQANATVCNELQEAAQMPLMYRIIL